MRRVRLDKNAELIQVIKRLSEENAIGLLTKDTDTVSLDSNYESVLSVAVKKEKFALIDAILNNTTRIRNSDIGAALLEIVKINNLHLLKKVCQKVIPEVLKEALNQWCYANDDTALHLAAKNNNKQIFKYLYELGAKDNIKNMEGVTALDLIQQKGAENEKKTTTEQEVQVETDDNLLTPLKNYMQTGQIERNKLDDILNKILRTPKKLNAVTLCQIWQTLTGLPPGFNLQDLSALTELIDRTNELNLTDQVQLSMDFFDALYKLNIYKQKDLRDFVIHELAGNLRHNISQLSGNQLANLFLRLYEPTNILARIKETLDYPLLQELSKKITDIDDDKLFEILELMVGDRNNIRNTTYRALADKIIFKLAEDPQNMKGHIGEWPKILTKLYHHWNEIPGNFGKLFAGYLRDTGSVNSVSMLWMSARLNISLDNDIANRLLDNVKKNIKELPLNLVLQACWSLAVLSVVKVVKLDDDFIELMFQDLMQKIDTQDHTLHANSLIQLQQLCLFYDWDLSDDLKLEIANAANSALTVSESSWEKKVSSEIFRILRNSSLNIQKEYLIENYKHVDLCFPEYKTILELDGKFHRDKEGNLRFKDQFNESILNKLGYQVLRIYQADYENVKGKEKEFLNNFLTENNIAGFTPVHTKRKDKNSSPIGSKNMFSHQSRQRSYSRPGYRKEDSKSLTPGLKK